MPIFLSLRTSFEINANKALFFEYLFFCYSSIQIPNSEVVVEVFLCLFPIMTSSPPPTSFEIQASFRGLRPPWAAVCKGLSSLDWFAAAGCTVNGTV